MIPDFNKRIIIKKFDNALRSNISAELYVLIESIKIQICFIINSIPSMNRITIDVFQLINGKFLEKTKFVNDPHDKVKSIKGGSAGEEDTVVKMMSELH